MIKKIKKPKYGDIKKSRIKFALFPKKFRLNDEYLWVWLERYVDYYEYTRARRCDMEDYWKYVYSRIINRNGEELWVEI